jgi:hypothetical protein
MTSLYHAFLLLVGNDSEAGEKKERLEVQIPSYILEYFGRATFK